MTYEYKCEQGHTTERFGVPVHELEIPIKCPECGQIAINAVSLNQGFALYGKPDGYTNPSATKRHSYKKIAENYKN